MAATGTARKKPTARKTPARKPAASTTTINPPTAPLGPVRVSPAAAAAMGFGPDVPVLRLTTEDQPEPVRAPIFYIDDDEHTVWTNPPAGVGITALDILADGRPYSEPRANRFLMTTLIGEQSYRALVSQPDLTAQQYAQVAEACSRIAMAAVEGQKNPTSGR